LYTELQISRVLVVYKKSYYELYGYEHRERHFTALQERQHPLIETMRLSHDENQRALADVCAALEAVRLPYDCLYRGELKSSAGYDLLLSVGGDGTFLEVARYTTDIPVLGVNSDPLRSTALFCAADRTNVRQRLEALLAGSLHEVRLARLQVSINGSQLPHYALNDLLVAHDSPAAVTSYTLQLGDISESQKSSGIWIATAAGSTAAVRAAGGRVMPLRSRKLQYLVREPYFGDGCRYRLLKGLVAPDIPLCVTSKMRRGSLFMDGPHLRFRLRLGDELRVTTITTPPIRVIGLDRARRQRF
jgi:NAD+ kinase